MVLSPALIGPSAFGYQRSPQKVVRATKRLKTVISRATKPRAMLKSTCAVVRANTVRTIPAARNGALLSGERRISVAPRRYGCSGSGRATEPSSRRWTSSSAASTRGTARPEPLRVCSSSVPLPSVGR